MHKCETDVKHILQVHGNALYRSAFLLLGNSHDVQDILQEVLLRYLEKSPVFQSAEHEKAWLLRVAINACKDYLKSFFRKNTVSLESLGELEEQITEDYREVLEAVLSLPVKYKDAVYLHYYEGYTAFEIGKILGKKENSVYSLLSRGRQMLKEKLGGDWSGQ